MNIAATIIGIFGSVAAFIGAVMSIYGEALVGFLDPGSGEKIIWLGGVGVLLAIAGLIGSCLSLAKPMGTVVILGSMGLVLAIVVFTAVATDDLVWELKNPIVLFYSVSIILWAAAGLFAYQATREA